MIWPIFSFFLLYIFFSFYFFATFFLSLFSFFFPTSHIFYLLIYCLFWGDIYCHNCWHQSVLILGLTTRVSYKRKKWKRLKMRKDVFLLYVPLWILHHEHIAFKIFNSSKSFFFAFYEAWCTKHKHIKRISVNNANRNVCLTAGHNYEFLKNVIYHNFNFHIYIYIYIYVCVCVCGVCVCVCVHVYVCVWCVCVWCVYVCVCAFYFEF